MCFKGIKVQSLKFVKLAGTVNLKFGGRYVRQKHYKLHYLRGVGAITGTFNLKIGGAFCFSKALKNTVPEVHENCWNYKAKKLRAFCAAKPLQRTLFNGVR